MLKKLKNNFSQRGAANIPIIIGLLLIGVALPAALRLVQQQQETRRGAAYTCPICKSGGPGSARCSDFGLENASGTCPIGEICCKNPDPTSAPTATPRPSTDCSGKSEGDCCGANGHCVNYGGQLVCYGCPGDSTCIDGRGCVAPTPPGGVVTCDADEVCVPADNCGGLVRYNKKCGVIPGGYKYCCVSEPTPTRVPTATSTPEPNYRCTMSGTCVADPNGNFITREECVRNCSVCERDGTACETSDGTSRANCSDCCNSYYCQGTSCYCGPQPTATPASESCHMELTPDGNVCLGSCPSGENCVPVGGGCGCETEEDFVSCDVDEACVPPANCGGTVLRGKKCGVTPGGYKYCCLPYPTPTIVPTATPTPSGDLNCYCQGICSSVFNSCEWRTANPGGLWRSCADRYCGPEPTPTPRCVNNGGECGANSECCSGNCDLSQGMPGICRSSCVNNGGECGANSDCCSGYCDLSQGMPGVCRVRVSPTPTGYIDFVECASDEECSLPSECSGRTDYNRPCGGVIGVSGESTTYCCELDSGDGDCGDTCTGKEDCLPDLQCGIFFLPPNADTKICWNSSPDSRCETSPTPTPVSQRSCYCVTGACSYGCQWWDEDPGSGWYSCSDSACDAEISPTPVSQRECYCVTRACAYGCVWSDEPMENMFSCSASACEEEIEPTPTPVSQRSCYCVTGACRYGCQWWDEDPGSGWYSCSDRACEDEIEPSPIPTDQPLPTNTPVPPVQPTNTPAGPGGPTNTPVPPVDPTNTPEEGECVTGDADCDGDVDYLDFSAWRSAMFDGTASDTGQCTGNGNSVYGDTNCNGTVEYIDFSVWRSALYD